ncbi:MULTISPECIES: DUF3793 family protein [unclassified Dehalobacter]|uniref:DUF3793 family protein n=1 Tax=unclassified Dehalobacter TaxID=2635733 RepID=UPI00036A6E09|nr:MULTISPECIES: DUF3793 family protein [unclassified Dehalobacter]RJE49027.1 hypothetical protein A7K50_07910 [Dehalobacter sp. MCB1]TCX51767.1 DUF3793 domain-containing protein [Dehalobacter sp. 14DCB1]TCX52827.1 DUF3793 domain-containing protein [Dehalobacter sp. 12DCB1]
MQDFIATYTSQRKKLETRKYLLDNITYHLAPLLIASKPAELLTFTTAIKKDVLETWDQIKDRLHPYVTVQEIVRNKASVSILFYIADRLSSILQIPENQHFLRSLGYFGEMDQDTAIQALKQKWLIGTFPHEIGLFLGFPLDDVADFIYFPDKKPLLIGYWKVYHSPEKARRIFREYNEARHAYIRYMLDGNKSEDFLKRMGGNGLKGSSI